MAEVASDGLREIVEAEADSDSDRVRVEAVLERGTDDFRDTTDAEATSSTPSVHWKCRIIDLVAHYLRMSRRSNRIEDILTVIWEPLAANHLCRWRQF